jgi:hypothetical protein
MVVTLLKNYWSKSQESHDFLHSKARQQPATNQNEAAIGTMSHLEVDS